MSACISLKFVYCLSESIIWYIAALEFWVSCSWASIEEMFVMGFICVDVYEGISTCLSYLVELESSFHIIDIDIFVSNTIVHRSRHGVSKTALNLLVLCECFNLFLCEFSSTNPKLQQMGIKPPLTQQKPLRKSAPSPLFFILWFFFFFFFWG